MPATSSSPLPLGVVCTDAIEQLDPFVPSSSLARERLTRRNDARDASTAGRLFGRRSPIQGVGSGTWQIVLTALPLMMADWLALFVAAGGSSSFGLLVLGAQPGSGVWPPLILIIATFTAVGMLMGLYPATGVSPVFELRQSVLAAALAFALMLLVNNSFGTVSILEWTVGIAGGCVACILVPIVRMSARKMLRDQSWWGERAVIIGSGPQGRAIYRFYRRATERGLRPIGLIDTESSPGNVDSSETDLSIPYLGSIRRLDRLRRRYRLRWGVVAPGGCHNLDLNDVMAHAGNMPNLLILPSQFLLPSLWASTRECAGVMGVHLRDHLRNPIAQVLKRGSDWLIAFTASLCLLPLLVLIALLIKVCNPGPVFYGHKRIGFGGKTFKAWKFRTMVTNADEVLEQHLEADPEMRRQWIEDQKLKDDPRIIPRIGSVLRKTSLDELPQLFNVLWGQMSIVGPRPIVQNEVDRYNEMFPLYLRVRPGITGLWQVSGRNDTSYSQRVRLDSYYVCNWSIWLDIYIMIRTLRTLLLREGAY